MQVGAVHKDRMCRQAGRSRRRGEGGREGGGQQGVSIGVYGVCMEQRAGGEQGIEYLQFNLAREAIFPFC